MHSLYLDEWARIANENRMSRVALLAKSSFSHLISRQRVESSRCVWCKWTPLISPELFLINRICVCVCRVKREIGDITKLKPDARQTEEKKKRAREKRERERKRVINYDDDYELIITRPDSRLRRHRISPCEDLLFLKFSFDLINRWCPSPLVKIDLLFSDTIGHRCIENAPSHGSSSLLPTGHVDISESLLR